MDLSIIISNAQYVMSTNNDSLSKHNKGCLRSVVWGGRTGQLWRREVAAEPELLEETPTVTSDCALIHSSLATGELLRVVLNFEQPNGG